jgi:hypothetical protein
MDILPLMDLIFVMGVIPLAIHALNLIPQFHAHLANKILSLKIHNVLVWKDFI